MTEEQKRLVVAIEQSVLQTLSGNKGKSNKKTSILHGAVEDYISAKYQNINWEHEKKIEKNDWKFNVDMFAVNNKKAISILLKNPMRSMDKNKYNALVNTWGEGIRVSLIASDMNKPLGVLWVSIYPTTDIVVLKKNVHGEGSVKLNKDYKAIPTETYNAGYDMIEENNTSCRYIGVPFDYAITPTLKTLKGIQGALEATESGQRIIIAEETWDALDEAIDWLLDGF